MPNGNNASPNTSPEATRDLVISRLLKAPRAKVWRAWSDPELLRQWWCPKPWTTEVRAFDLRPGGAFHTFMQGPDGGTSDNPGCFLEVVPMERIVSTSALVAGYRPATPWLSMTAVITMEDEGDGTRYTARVMHPDEATRKQHEELGFHEGWNTCITQLEEFASQLK
ncbi:activator of HSP90 ATPase [Cupriavidus sp. TA19]|uniref:SRPBCC family protein n=1 Tax=unclassified Cupriavidus TaxID=2640874 RepID=UPI000E2F4628|nr:MULTISPECIES: SRPBCC family protein [unclassified Cupriavidus]BDB26812.1 SRPBCC family protein [Cupriavidus sp. P-10]GLC92581.1 activator of HSP90 ATPase [Cupriavidus sp. TA19]